MKRYLTLLLISFIILCQALVGCTGSKGQPPLAEASRKEALSSVVLGFYTDSQNAKESMLSNIKKLNEVAFFWYTFDGTGLIKRAGNVDLGLKATVQKDGVKAYALVHNMGAGGFNSQLAHQVLANGTSRSKFINNLVDLSIKEDWDGISIDLEKIPDNDRSNYSAFLDQLHTALKAKNKILNVSIPAKYQDDPNDLWTGAFDYTAVGQAADQIVLMTYEEHGIGTTQGPIASQGWVNRVIDFASSKIPKEKIIMGLPVYASDWASNSPTVPSYLTYAKATSIASGHKVSILYDRTQQVPHFAYTVGNVRHEVYLEDVRSLTAKLSLAKNTHLQGVAIWRLGIEDPALWTKVLEGYGKG